MPHTDSPVGILVAVEEELRRLLGRCSGIRAETVSGVRIHRARMAGRDLCLAKSGLGTGRAERTANVLLERASPSSLLIAGFAGALSEAVRPGDLVIADAAQSSDGRLCFEPDPCLRRVAASAAPRELRIHAGILLTGQGVQQSGEGKRALAAAHPRAIALDMETAGGAAAAQRSGVPWAAVRAITDGLVDDMPLPFDRFVGAVGEMNRARILAAVLARPWKVPALLRLGVRSTRAAGNLAAFVEAYIRALASTE